MKSYLKLHHFLCKRIRCYARTCLTTTRGQSRDETKFPLCTGVSKSRVWKLSFAHAQTNMAHEL